MNDFNKIRNVCTAHYLLFFVFLSFMFTGCTENVDDSNFAIKREITAADFIAADENYSSMKRVFEMVKLGSSEGASSILSVLSARGNYTLFLATNQAVNSFLAECGVTEISELTEEQLNMIATNCIIDNQQAGAYETSDFPLAGSFDKPNLNDRMLTCEIDEFSNYIVNGKSKVIIEDNEVSNGCVHVVDRVIAPSVLTLDKMIGITPNLRIFSALLQKTTWADSLHGHMDLSYENPDRTLSEKIAGLVRQNLQHRYVGYTAFVEPDNLFQTKWNIIAETDKEGHIINWDEIYPVIKNRCEAVYGKDEIDNLAHPDNAVNRFVAYHLIGGKISYDKFVQHFNEFNYKFGNPMRPQVTNCPTNVWDFYTSMGKHPGLLKVVQVGDGGFENDTEHRMYLNRMPIYADGPNDNYKELGVVEGHRGVLISVNNGKYDNNALNGFYYPVDDILMYHKKFRNELFRRRIRVDFVTMLPELLSNNVRCGKHAAFEPGYFDNITRESQETKLLYTKANFAGGWWCYQGDFFLLSGLYDATIKLPPVPKDGTYELRMAVVHNSTRGMCQIYFGDDPDRLKPVGLPYDMRQKISSENPEIPWFEDTENLSRNQEIDKNLRNQGYMKAPRFYCVANGQGDTPVRSKANGARRIITIADMKADKTYYLRYKSALKKNDSQCQLDYLEFASSAVYNNVQGENVW